MSFSSTYFCEICNSVLQIKDGNFTCVLCKNTKKIENNKVIYRISYTEEETSDIYLNKILTKYDIYRKSKNVHCKNCKHDVSLMYSDEDMNTKRICEKCNSIIVT